MSSRMPQEFVTEISAHTNRWVFSKFDMELYDLKSSEL